MNHIFRNKIFKKIRRERDSSPCTLSRSCFRDSRLTTWLPRHLVLDFLHNKANQRLQIGFVMRIIHQKIGILKT